MARPKSKKELVEQSKANFSKLISLVESYSKEDQNLSFEKGMLNNNIRDVITHIHHWHLFMELWYKEGMAGKKPEMPAPGYTWQTLPALNKKVWEKYQKTSLEEALSLVATSHQTIQEIIESHSDNDLFTKKKYNWTGSTSLAAYLISNTASHYNWGIKIIKKGMK